MAIAPGLGDTGADNVDVVVMETVRAGYAELEHKMTRCYKCGAMNETEDQHLKLNVDLGEIVDRSRAQGRYHQSSPRCRSSRQYYRFYRDGDRHSAGSSPLFPYTDQLRE